MVLTLAALPLIHLTAGCAGRRIGLYRFRCGRPRWLQGIYAWSGIHRPEMDVGLALQ